MNNLSPVYLDGTPITLMGDEARPPVSRIVRASGKRPDRVDVRRLTDLTDSKGKVLGREEIVDRTLEPVKPIYLKTVARAQGHRGAGRTTIVKGRDASPIVQSGPVDAVGSGEHDRAGKVSRERPRLDREAARLEAEAQAEAEAEQRREEQREEQDILQDDQEALDDAESDSMGDE